MTPPVVAKTIRPLSFYLAAANQEERVATVERRQAQNAEPDFARRYTDRAPLVVHGENALLTHESILYTGLCLAEMIHWLDEHERVSAPR